MRKDPTIGDFDPTLARWIGQGARDRSGPAGAKIRGLLRRPVANRSLLLWHAARLQDRARCHADRKARRRSITYDLVGSRAIVQATLLDAARTETEAGSSIAKTRSLLKRALPCDKRDAAFLEGLEDLARQARKAWEART